MSCKDQNHNRIQWELGERRKELAALHETARLLQQHDREPAEVLSRVCALIPASWQFPDITEARVEYADEVHTTPGYTEQEPGRRQTETFITNRGTAGRIDVVYLEERPAAAEGPFLTEERDLLRSLAEMLQTYFDHQEADAELEAAADRLDREVKERTAELSAANRVLEQQGERLRELAREATLADERQRRAIASDLHDHLGQALAFIRMQLAELQGDLMFSGVEGRLDSIRDLLDKAIRYTRTLTAEISPPVLYDLGFAPAMDWLADEMRRKHGLPVTVRTEGDAAVDEEGVRVVLFLTVRELLVNAAKHAEAGSVEVWIHGGADRIRVRVTDNGRGFDVGSARRGESFGLSNVTERIRSLGGELTIESVPGQGTGVEVSVPRGKEAMA